MDVNWKESFSKSPILFKKEASWTGLNLCHRRVISGELPEHTPQNHEISIVIEGNLTARRQTSTGIEQKLFCNEDGICLSPAGQPVSADWNSQMEHLSIELQPDFIQNSALENRFSTNFNFILNRNANDLLMRQIGFALLEESNSETPGGRLYAESLTQTMVLHLLKNYTDANSKPEKNGGLSGYKLRLVKEYINENLEEDLGLTELAKVAGLSRFHFARAFRQATGFTPQNYLMQQRVEMAKKLLSKKDLPLVEISFRTGFKTQSHFTTLFRKYTKLTPKMWRELKLA